APDSRRLRRPTETGGNRSASRERRMVGARRAYLGPRPHRGGDRRRVLLLARSPAPEVSARQLVCLRRRCGSASALLAARREIFPPAHLGRDERLLPSRLHFPSLVT